MESEAQVKSSLPKFIQLTSDRDYLLQRGVLQGKVILEQYKNEVVVSEAKDFKNNLDEKRWCLN